MSDSKSPHNSLPQASSCKMSWAPMFYSTKWRHIECVFEFLKKARALGDYLLVCLLDAFLSSAMIFNGGQWRQEMSELQTHQCRSPDGVPRSEMDSAEGRNTLGQLLQCCLNVHAFRIIFKKCSAAHGTRY